VATPAQRFDVFRPMFGGPAQKAALGVALWLSVFSVALHAQQNPPKQPSEASCEATDADRQDTSARNRIARWFELQTVTLNLRYRFVDDSAGVITTNQLQHREALAARVKFDRGGRYALSFGVFTGVRFGSGWNNTPFGIDGAQDDLAFKTLYVNARPVDGLEGQIGGLSIVKGESTEITTYDEDGYLMGERVTVRRPNELFLDEIAFTNAYFDERPEMIPVGKRFRHLDSPNYRQLLVRKTLGDRTALSMDYTVVNGARTWRQAVNFKLNELRLLDSVVLEAYQRTNMHPDQGFAVTAHKRLGSHLSVHGGYAFIDPDYGGLNADRFNIGRRVFGMAIYAFSPEFQASAFVTTAVGQNGTLPQRTLSNVVFTFDAVPALKRTGLF
jgi:hypothetical protein